MKYKIIDCHELYKVTNKFDRLQETVNGRLNKNTLTGPVNCKKTTRHHADLSLCAKLRKTKDGKSRKCPKTSIWAIFLTISRSNISKLQILMENRVHPN